MKTFSRFHRISSLTLAAILFAVLFLSGCGGSAELHEESSAAPAQTETPAAEPEEWAADGAADAEYDAIYPAPSPAVPEEYDDVQGDFSDGESYLVIDENRTKYTDRDSMLTFSLKVDTAAYTNVARYLESGNLPPRDAVRTEELINYFRYDEELRFGSDPFAIYTEIGPSPFHPDYHMAFVRVKTKDIDKGNLPKSNLTFLIDTSGSMDSYDKLPLLKEAFQLLVDTLDEDDRVSIVTYAGSSAVVLDSESGANKERILSAINHLEAGGSTAGADGILTAYALAEKNFVKDGNNRVILATDGDFNVGISDTDSLANLVSEKKDGGVYLSILGFGTGNIRDDIMETLSKNGNGNYAYIHSVQSAQKVLVDELAANLFTVADDVKAQVEFNPATVKSYRLIGYENRKLNNEDFEDDTKDAGEIGAGTDVVMLFELELAGSGGGEGLKYADNEGESAPDYADELFEVRIRYKDPGKSSSKLVERPVTFGSIPNTNTSDYTFACSVAALGHLLRDSEYGSELTAEQVIDMAKGSLGQDEEGYRLDHLMLLKSYQQIVHIR